MKTYAKMALRAFTVTVKDARTDEVKDDIIVLDKATLQAAQLVGESSENIINRLYNRKGYKVLNIDKPIKCNIKVDLLDLFKGGEL